MNIFKYFYFLKWYLGRYTAVHICCIVFINIYVITMLLLYIDLKINLKKVVNKHNKTELHGIKVCTVPNIPDR